MKDIANVPPAEAGQASRSERPADGLEVADSGMAAAVETGEKAGEIYQEYILISITQDMTVT